MNSSKYTIEIETNGIVVRLSDPRQLGEVIATIRALDGPQANQIADSAKIIPLAEKLPRPQKDSLTIARESNHLNRLWTVMVDLNRAPDPVHTTELAKSLQIMGGPKGLSAVTRPARIILSDLGFDWEDVVQTGRSEEGGNCWGRGDRFKAAMQSVAALREGRPLLQSTR